MQRDRSEHIFGLARELDLIAMRRPSRKHWRLRVCRSTGIQRLKLQFDNSCRGAVFIADPRCIEQRTSSPSPSQSFSRSGVFRLVKIDLFLSSLVGLLSIACDSLTVQTDYRV
jgi:hypothetical protein